MSKEPTFEQLEARQFFLYPNKTSLPRVVDLALIAFDEWQERWENACAALQAIGVKWNDEEMELEKAFSERQNERSAS
jgi:hypothetical protein